MKSILIVLFYMTSICCSQVKTYFNIDGTLKEEFTVGRGFNAVIPVSSVYKDSLKTGSVFYYDSVRKAFIPLRPRPGAFLRWNHAGTALTAADGSLSVNADTAEFSYKSDSSLFAHRALSLKAGDTLYYTAESFIRNISGSFPIDVSMGREPVISINKANGNNDGYLSGDDWQIFNGKCSLSDLNAVNPIVYSSGVFSLPQASSSTDGYLDNLDWMTFNSKVSLTIMTDSLDARAEYEEGERSVLSASITMNARAIQSEVTDRTNADSLLQGSITLNSDAINLRVTKNDVINQINLSTESVDINGSKINISGLTTFADGYNPSLKINLGSAAADINNNATTINGSKITTGTITALGSVTAGSFNLGNGRFQVDENGYMTATGVNLSGNFTVGTSTISPGAGSGEISFNNAQLWYCSWKGLNLNISQINNLQNTLDQKASLSQLDGKVSKSSLHLSGEGAPSGSPGDENMTYYDSNSGHYYVNFGTGAWVRVVIQ